ncbi:hypothetical protein EPR50_G00104150 [Perca flavescens]|uniref:Polyadenylate-binding protein-interacting protein 2 n=2 Tax=Perca flavescens TaxID=8167 RepID=A0A484CWE2_PERFV|nr:hypothetical protein EPR50_G00104150 [Perca flavescens]
MKENDWLPVSLGGWQQSVSSNHKRDGSDVEDVNKQRHRGHDSYRRVRPTVDRSVRCRRINRVFREMRDPSLSDVFSNMTIRGEVILSSQLGSEDEPFAEYLWMEHEEEFNRQVEEELWEEEFIERCFQEMLEEEEQWEWFIPSRDLPALQLLDADVHADADFLLTVSSSLNPNAKEFTPGSQKHVM